MEGRRPWPGRGLDSQRGEGALRIVVAGALVIALAIAALGFVQSPAKTGAAASSSNGLTANAAPAPCPDDRRGVAYYRQRYSEHRAIRGLATPYPAGRKPRNCADARYLARVWPARSLRARRAAERWVEEERERSRIPVGEAELRAYIDDDCLEEIVDRETAGTWDPTVRNYSTGIAYGLPQAVPGEKMASHGADWRTNPKTQIAWMRSYVNGRYGGSCGALAFHNANGWY